MGVNVLAIEPSSFQHTLRGDQQFFQALPAGLVTFEVYSKALTRGPVGLQLGEGNQQFTPCMSGVLR